MSIERVEVKPYLVSRKCDKCSAHMVATGRMLTSNPPQFPHKCEECGYTMNYRKEYPCVEYERFEPETIDEVKRQLVGTLELLAEWRKTYSTYGVLATPPDHPLYNEKSAKRLTETLSKTDSLITASEGRWSVTAGHPILATPPDRHNLSKVFAEYYATSLKEQGFENVEMSLEV